MRQALSIPRNPALRWLGRQSPTGCNLHANGKGKRAAQVVVAAISQLVAVEDFDR